MIPIAGVDAPSLSVCAVIDYLSITYRVLVRRTKYKYVSVIRQLQNEREIGFESQSQSMHGLFGWTDEWRICPAKQSMHALRLRLEPNLSLVLQLGLSFVNNFSINLYMYMYMVV